MRMNFLGNIKKNITRKVGRGAAFFFFCLFFLNLTIFPVFVLSNWGTAEETFSPTLQKINSFSTWYNPNDVGRCENIALASSFIDGITVQPYGEFSFNQTVGKRLAERGFKNAKIILNGAFVKGIGGGVCQVSTTLYNVALLSGLTVTEYHPHSLSVTYVPPSLDAMVSSAHDLRFLNPYEFPIRIEMKTVKSGLIATAYGIGGMVETKYKLVSKVLEEILPPPPLECQEGERKAQASKNGIRSESYLEKYEKGVLVSRKLLRTDVYAPVREIIVKKIEDTTKKMP